MAVNRNKKMGIGTALFFAAFIALTCYFMFAAVQGEFGHLHRVQIEAEEKRLIQKLNELKAQRASIENKTLRLSDNYLDLDLLDEQSRKVLGMARVDEVIIR